MADGIWSCIELQSFNFILGGTFGGLSPRKYHDPIYISKKSILSTIQRINCCQGGSKSGGSGSSREAI